MINNLIAMIRDEEGATMVEYGLLVALIALVAIVGVTLLGDNLNDAVQHRGGLRLTDFPQRVTKRNLPTLLTHDVNSLQYANSLTYVNLLVTQTCLLRKLNRCVTLLTA